MNHVGLYGMVVDHEIKLDEDDEGKVVVFTISNLRRVADDLKEITYVPVRCFDWLAETVVMNAKKGDMVLVEGKLVQNEVQNMAGDRTYKRLEIEAKKILFLDQRRLDFPESYTKRGLTNG